MSEHKAPSIEAARKMGEVGGPAVEEERLAFEAWMAGHCWELGATWNGTAYVGDREVDGRFVSPKAIHTRGLWAAWRDRAALARMATDERIEQLETALRLAADEPNIDRARAIADAALAPESISDTLHDCAHKDTGKVRAAVAYGKREAAE